MMQTMNSEDTPISIITKDSAWLEPQLVRERLQRYARTSMILGSVLSCREPNIDALLELLENLTTYPRARRSEWFVGRSGSPGLDAKFDEFNEKYFKGRLPKYQVYQGFNHSPRILGECHSRKRIILIRYDLTPLDVLDTLLHEMTHIRILGHAHRFEREMKRLRDLGAPILASEFSEFE
jgi:hypothetical protein